MVFLMLICFLIIALPLGILHNEAVRAYGLRVRMLFFSNLTFFDAEQYYNFAQ